MTRKYGGKYNLQHQGAGFFGDLWDGIKGVASHVAPVVLGKVLGGKKKKKGGAKVRKGTFEAKRKMAYVRSFKK